MPPKKKAKTSDGADWQWLDDDNVWQSFATDDSCNIESSYVTQCAVFVTKNLTFNKGHGTKYTFDFAKMEQINGDSGTTRKMRRLAPCSEYQWEWKDDSGLFVPFYEEDNTTIERLCLSAASTTADEASKTVKTKDLSFNKGYGSSYAFTFGPGGVEKDENGKAMTKGDQKNEESGNSREIRRIQKKNAWDLKGYGIAGMTPPKKEVVADSSPTKAAPSATSATAGGEGTGFDEDDDSPRAKDASKKKPTGDDDDLAVAPVPVPVAVAKKEAVAVIKTPSIDSTFGGSGLAVPFYWSGGGAKIGAATLISVSEVNVELKSDEAASVYAFVAGDFKANGKKCNITKITRVENTTLYTFYALRRAHIAKRNDGNPNEMRLCYGDHNKTNMNTICKLGFDTRVAQAGGTYGQGLYFGTEPSTYDSKCHQIAGVREMMICRAAVGTSAPGSKGIRRPPPKDPKKPSGDIFDCCANDNKNPTQFVFFENTQMYPEYIVTYTK